MLKRNRDQIVVVFGGDCLKVAHVRLDNASVEFIKIARRDIRGISDEELPKVIKSMIGDFNAKKPSAFCVFPSNAVTTKTIEIPSVDLQEIKSIVNLQAGRHTPYSREEIVVDFLNLGILQRSYTKIFLVIANRNIIKKQLYALEQAGVRVEKVLFSSEAIARFYCRALNLAAAHAPVALADINNQHTDFIVVANQSIVACRSIPIGMAHLLAEGQAAKDRLIQEFKSSTEAYQNENADSIIESFLLTGDNNTIKDLFAALKEGLPLNAKIVPYIDGVKITPEARKSILDAGDDSFLDIVCAPSVFQEAQIDLLPEEVKMQRVIENQGKEVVRSAVFIIVILMLICAWFFVKIYIKTGFLNKLKTSYNHSREEAETLARIAEKTGIIKDFLNNRLATLDIIYELYRIVPDEIYLNGIIVDESGKVTIQGTSESMSRVFSLVSALEESSLFKSVKTNSTAAKKERGKDLAAFELSFKLESAKDEEEDSKDAKESAKNREEKSPDKEK